MEKKDLSEIPQVEKLLNHPDVCKWIPLLSRHIVTVIIRNSLSKFRERAKEGKPLSANSIAAHISASCRLMYRRRIIPVVNGTGTILHTNMGRSPIPRESWDESADINCGYSNLEFSLASGKRGKRSGLIPELICALTGGESAIVVNNNAAAVFLILTALARGKEVIVSRGEQVQIGGGFRIPEILVQSGARIVEVGTTNMTSVKDYVAAVTPETAAILIVHPSNFAIRGFTARPDLKSLSDEIGGRVPIIVDQGSGVTTEELKGETRVRSYLKRGAALVSFSGDKVLGGPQAGIIVGDRNLIACLGSHPLYRAFRPGKTVLSLLETYLVHRLNGTTEGMVSGSLSVSTEDLKRLGKRIQRSLPPESVAVVPSFFTTGGGSSPDETFPSFSLEIRDTRPPEKIVEMLRFHTPPVIGVVQKGVVSINLATILEKDVPPLKEALASLFAAPDGDK